MTYFMLMVLGRYHDLFSKSKKQISLVNQMEENRLDAVKMLQLSLRHFMTKFSLGGKGGIWNFLLDLSHEI